MRTATHILSLVIIVLIYPTRIHNRIKSFREQESRFRLTFGSGISARAPLADHRWGFGTPLLAAPPLGLTGLVDRGFRAVLAVRPGVSFPPAWGHVGLGYALRTLCCHPPSGSAPW